MKYVYFKLGVDMKDRAKLIAYAIKHKHKHKALHMIQKHLKKMGATYDEAYIPFHECSPITINKYTECYVDTIFGFLPGILK